MMSVIDLPDVVLEHIFSFLSFDSVAQNRIVCKRFNVVGGRVLNKGFYAVEKFNCKTVRQIKAKLPRRESERRNHPLERQCSVLISVETRINMLAMTYSKWISNESCCFIPGKVIDEIYRVVRSVIKSTEHPGDCDNVRAVEILQELRDISSMAIEHFDDKILPQLKRNYYRSTVECMVDNGGGSDGNLMGVLDGLMEQNQNDNSFLMTSYKGCLQNTASPSTSPSLTSPNYLRLLIRESVNRMRLQAQSIQISNQSKEISDLRKQVDEWEHKFKELSSIVLKNKTPSPTEEEASTSGVNSCPNNEETESTPIPAERSSIKRRKIDVDNEDSDSSNPDRTVY